MAIEHVHLISNFIAEVGWILYSGYLWFLESGFQDDRATTKNLGDCPMWRVGAAVDCPFKVIDLRSE